MMQNCSAPWEIYSQAKKLGLENSAEVRQKLAEKVNNLKGMDNSYEGNFKFISIMMDPRYWFGQLTKEEEEIPDVFVDLLVDRILSIRDGSVHRVVQVDLNGRVECEYPCFWHSKLAVALVYNKIFVHVNPRCRFSNYNLLSSPLFPLSRVPAMVAEKKATDPIKEEETRIRNILGENHPAKKWLKFCTARVDDTREFRDVYMYLVPDSEVKEFNDVMEKTYGSYRDEKEEKDFWTSKVDMKNLYPYHQAVVRACNIPESYTPPQGSNLYIVNFALCGDYWNESLYELACYGGDFVVRYNNIKEKLKTKN